MSLKKIAFPYYKVKSGETLKSISEKFDVDATKILLENCLTPKDIKEGALIKIEK